MTLRSLIHLPALALFTLAPHLVQAQSFEVVAQFPQTVMRPSGGLIAGPNPDNSNLRLYGLSEFGGTGGAGVLYSYEPATNTFAIEADFGKDFGNAVSPTALSARVGEGEHRIVAIGGAIYGVTADGGTQGYGIVWKWTPTAVPPPPSPGPELVKIGEFNGLTTGGHPRHGVVTDGITKLYGTCSVGGGNSAGTLWEASLTSGTPAVLHSFHPETAASAVGKSLGGIAWSDNRLYGLGQRKNLTTEATEYVMWTYELTGMGNQMVDRYVFDTSTDFFPRGTLTANATGIVYGVTYGSATSDAVARIFRYDIGNNIPRVTNATLNASRGISLTVQSNMLYGIAQSGSGTGQSDGWLFSWQGGSASVPVISMATFAASDSDSPSGLVHRDSTDGRIYGTSFGGGSAGEGTLWRFIPVVNNTQSAGSVSTLHHCTAPTVGGYPGGVTAHPNGSIFGHERVGNSVWRWSPASPLERVASLTTAAQGSAMMGQMAVNVAGDVFGLTGKGGSNSNGTLYQWNQHAGVAVKGNFGSATAGGVLSGGSVMDANGNLYGITNQLNGALAPTTRLWRLTAAGVFSTVATFNSVNHGAYSVGNLAVDSTGAVYGVCMIGGTGNNGTLWKWAPGTGLTRLGIFLGSSNPRRPYGGVAVKPDGTEVYGTAEPSNNTQSAILWKWTSEAGFTVSGTLTRASHGEPFTFDSQVAIGGVNVVTASLPIVISSTGTLFGVTDRNGPSSLGCGVLWSFATGAVSPTISVVKAFQRSENDGGRGILGLTFGSDGRLYGATDNALWRFGSPPAAQAPSAVTKASTLQTATRLTLAGAINAHGVTTNVSFEYGLSPTNLNRTVVATPATANGTSATNVSVTLKFLTPATTYYYRVVGVSNNGTSYGGIAKATTGPSAGPPVVTTGASSAIGHASATLAGTVNPQHMSNVVDIVFQWGLSATALTSSTVASPATATGTTVTDVTAALTVLQPHTKYFYRVAAAGDHGLGLGPVQSFTTLNRQPVGMGDGFTALPGAPVTMNVLSNDSDPDLDTISVKSFTQPAAGVGKVTKSGNNLVFTPGVAFDPLGGPVTFTYILQDSLGATAAAPITVTITPDTIAISPTSNPGLLAEATSYNITVDTGAAATPWRAVETSPFITLNTVSGIGDGMVQVNVAANTTMNPRAATIVIGGQLHTLTQAGVVAPVVNSPGMVPPAVVSGSFSMPFHTYLPPAKYTATKLPPGLKVVVNPTTGEAAVQGIPDKEGTYPVTIKASNAASNAGNAAASTISFNIVVRPLPLHMVGDHVAQVGSNVNFNSARGAVIQFKTLATGSFTGSVRLGQATTAPETLPFKGRLTVTPVLEPNPIPPATVTVSVARKAPLPPLVLNLILETAATTGENIISGSIGVQGEMPSTTALSGWRNKWTLAAPATIQLSSTNKPVKEIFNTFFSPVLGEETPPDVIPLGDGLVTFTLEPAGVVTWVASMPDGVTATGKLPLSPTNDLFVWMSLYKKAVLDYIGRMSGFLTIARPADTVSGSVTWVKALQPVAPGVAPTYNYLGGFTTTRTITGARHQVPTATLFQLPDMAGNALLNFQYGGIGAATQAGQINQNFKITTANTAVFSAPANPALVKMTINKALGTYSGTFSLTDGAVKRSNIAFKGVIIDAHLPTGYGRGFFVLPQLPVSGTSTATTLRLSGSTQLLPD